MKKLLKNDKKRRYLYLKNTEKKYFVLRLIFRNFNFFVLVRWFALFRLNFLAKVNSKVSLISKCLWTFNKKRFNKLVVFSRHIFIKLLRKGLVSNFCKSS